eukprot:9434925-Pyramimonas_sp.AAC.1
MVPKLLAEVLTHVPKVVFEPAQVAHLNAVPPRGGDLPITSYFYFEVAYTRKCQGYQKGKGFKRKAKQPKFAHVPTACIPLQIQVTQELITLSFRPIKCWNPSA